jgi:hypothetical protein
MKLIIYYESLMNIYIPIDYFSVICHGATLSIEAGGHRSLQAIKAVVIV